MNLAKVLNMRCQLLFLIIMIMVGIAVPPAAHSETFDFTKAVLRDSDQDLIVLQDEAFSIGYFRRGILYDNAYRSWLCESAAICSAARDQRDAKEGETRINVAFSGNDGATQTLVAYATKTQFYPKENWRQFFSQPLNQVYGGAWTTWERPGDYRWLVSIKFPSEEIKKLPFGGSWKGTINLRSFHGDGGREPAFDININLNLIVTDFANAQIYFLDTKLSNASIPMPLLKSQVGTNATFSSEASVDTCLYDSFEANSSSYNLSVLDNAEATEDNNYYLRPETNKNNLTAKLPLNVSIDFNGKNIGFLNSKTSTRLEKAEPGSIRSVSLPNIDGVVRCAIARLNLRIPNINALETPQGKYATKLRIIFTPNA